MSAEPEKSIQEVIRSDGRYPPPAFAFLHECLARAVQGAYGPDIAQGKHHVTGQQVCLAMKELALERWGLLARGVLAKWNIRQTIDMGNMVYLLIGSGLWTKTPQDSVEDFRDVFDFEQAFAVEPEFELKE